jgi:hypothetical protein
MFVLCLLSVYMCIVKKIEVPDWLSQMITRGSDICHMSQDPVGLWKSTLCTKLLSLMCELLFVFWQIRAGCGPCRYLSGL